MVLVLDTSCELRIAPAGRLMHAFQVLLPCDTNEMQRAGHAGHLKTILLHCFQTFVEVPCLTIAQNTVSGAVGHEAWKPSQV